VFLCEDSSVVRYLTRICARCRGCLVEEGSVLKPVAGDLVHELPEAVPLCSDCSGLFRDWLKSGDPTHHAAPHGPLGTVVDSLALPATASV
jgi:hypothetical protein